MAKIEATINVTGHISHPSDRKRVSDYKDYTETNSLRRLIRNLPGVLPNPSMENAKPGIRKKPQCVKEAHVKPELDKNVSDK